MPQKKDFPSTRFLIYKKLLLVGLIFILILGFIYQRFIFYQSHFLPRTSINQIDISNLDFLQAQTKLSSFIIHPQDKIIFTALDEKISSTSAQLELNDHIDTTLADILVQQQNLAFLNFLSTFAVSTPRSYNLSPSFNPTALRQMISALAQRLNQPGKAGYLLLQKTGDLNSLIIEAGQDKITLNQAEAFQLVSSNLGHISNFSLPVEQEPLKYTSSQIKTLTSQANSILNQKLTFDTDQVDNFSFTLSDLDLIPLLGASSSTQLAIKNNFADIIDASVKREPQEPILELTDGAVTKFIPPLDGLQLDRQHFFSLINQSLNQLLATDEAQILNLDLPLTTASPKKSLSQTNDLGINELLGFGESYYAHSSSGRIHNVVLTASRINNTLVAPGEEFSFNHALGDVSSNSGYQAGYVIKGGRSELSAGGGVCQVSTTLFRALLDSGLKITLRRPHSYRVSYYELNNDPGFDATVYSGNVDLRFINDTNRYLLISTQTDVDNLYMTAKIYGTSDGRYTTITNYKKFNAKKAPAPEYITDPSLPSGAVKQIDWAVGGLQTNFTHTIYNADGSIRNQKDYPSTYQAWSSKYLVGP